MKLKYSFLLFLLLAAASAIADSEIPPFAKVDSPRYGSCYIKQIPFNIIDGVEEDFVIAYKILPDGSDELLWKSSGWYAHRVFLTGDCQYLVRMGNWARGSEPSPEDLAVAFYKNGELLNTYSTFDLVKDKENVHITTGHYSWQSKDRKYPRLEIWSDTFYLKTIEENLLEFNYKTGVLKNH